jgi:hypothetical protein
VSAESQLYRLKLDLRVLDHLGMKLYSNAAAVLSEAVANSWDADAHRVIVKIDDDQIAIEDDGAGMNLQGINGRFLNVGYAKRAGEGDESDGGRRFMGRKGIGKLALFSIADEIQVHTNTGSERHAFRMLTPAIREAIEADRTYFPDPIGFAGPEGHGTRLVLRTLRKKRTSSSIPALRKRVARRFSVIGRTNSKGDAFNVLVNGTPIGAEDRDDLQAVEFLWEFGEQRVSTAEAPALKKSFLVPDQVDPVHQDWRVRGWFGAARQPSDLRRESGSLNGLVVLARGRLIQENILDRLGFSRVLVSYLTGQIEADFLDISKEDDIATSDRQRVVEDDERYTTLVSFLRQTIVTQQDVWTDLRVSERGKQATEEQPALAAWIASLPESHRPPAERLLGLIRGVELDDEEQRLQLYRSGLVAFERLKIRDQAHLLASGAALTVERLLPLLSDINDLEATLYLEIIRGRLEVLRKFTDLVDANARERVLQQHLFENLWLLDSGWERAAGSERLEQRLKTEFKDVFGELTDEESKGRVDIRYKTNAGQHIIVELKKADRRLKVSELVEQGSLYRAALQKCLASMGKHDQSIEVVFVLGQPVAEETNPGGLEMVSRTLSGISGRVVQYEELISNARAEYQEYLTQGEKVTSIDSIISQLR